MMCTGAFHTRNRVFWGFLSLALLSAAPGALASRNVTLAWDPSTDNTVVGYNIYYGTASRTYTNLVSVISTNAATVSNLTASVTYYFAATAYTASGLESEFSTEASYSVPSGTNPVAPNTCIVSGGFAPVPAGQSGSFPLYVSSSDGLTNLEVVMAWAPVHLVKPSLSGGPGSGSLSLQDQITNVIVQWQASPGQPLLGSALLGQLNFQTVSNQLSAKVALPLLITDAAKPDGQKYAHLETQPALVYLVSDQPLLDASLASNAVRNLTVYGNPGTAYQVQYAANPGAGITWRPLVNYTQTNLAQPVAIGSTNPFVFYRVFQP